MNTNELIAEARRQVGHIEDKSMRERLIARLADALDARQPSENDREALKRIAEVASEQRLKESIGEWREALGAGIDSFPDDWELEFWHAGYKHGALAMIEHQLSRAAVPDAAPDGQVIIPIARIHELRAAKDAALAAVEAVRKLHEPFEAAAGRTYCGDCSGAAGSGNLRFWPCPTIQALDGAPEPETAPENYEPKCNGACVVHGSPVTNWPVQYGRRNRETGALHWLKGDPLDSWWHENQDNYEHVKRYTSPPLPVEGEPNGEREALYVSPAIQAVREYFDQLEEWEAQNHVIEELRSLVDDIPCCETATAMPHEEHSRATVPDAATEFLEAVNKIEAQKFDLRVERDAATAAIDRVRDILNRDDFGDDWEHDEWVYRDAAEKKLADIEAALDSGIDTSTAPKDYRPNCKCSAALDGAPEPEWEYRYAEMLDGEIYTYGREEACFSTFQAASDARVEVADFVVRRRKAGPWLPVEGDKP